MLCYRCQPGPWPISPALSLPLIALVRTSSLPDANDARSHRAVDLIHADKRDSLWPLRVPIQKFDEPLTALVDPSAITYLEQLSIGPI